MGTLIPFTLIFPLINIARSHVQRINKIGDRYPQLIEEGEMCTLCSRLLQWEWINGRKSMEASSDGASIYISYSSCIPRRQGQKLNMHIHVYRGKETYFQYFCSQLCELNDNPMYVVACLSPGNKTCLVSVYNRPQKLIYTGGHDFCQ